MSNVELAGIVLAVAGIVISVLLALQASHSRRHTQSQKSDRKSINIQSGRDTKIK